MRFLPTSTTACIRCAFILLAVPLVGTSTAPDLVAQEILDERHMVSVGVLVVDRHGAFDAPMVIVMNPSFTGSEAVISIEADALDAAALERGLWAVQRALAGGAFDGREDAVLTVTTLQGPTGEGRAGPPSAVRERAEHAAEHFAPLIEARRRGDGGFQMQEAPGLDLLGAGGFVASINMSFPRSEISGNRPSEPGVGPWDPPSIAELTPG